MGSAYGVTKKVCLQNRRKTIKKIFFLYFEMAQSRKTWPLRASASKRGRVENYPFVCCGNKTDFYYSSELDRENWSQNKMEFNFFQLHFFHSFLSLKFRPISDLQIAAEIKISDLGITRKKIRVTKWILNVLR